MSQASAVRARRAIKRRVGVKRCTRRELLNQITIRALKRIMRETGVRVSHETAFSIEVDGATQRTRQILKEEGFLEAGPGNFVHKKMRLSDFCRAGISFSVMPKDDSLFLETAVTEEDVKRIGQLLGTTHAVRLDDL